MCELLLLLFVFFSFPVIIVYGKWEFFVIIERQRDYTHCLPLATQNDLHTIYPVGIHISKQGHVLANHKLFHIDDDAFYARRHLRCICFYWLMRDRLPVSIDASKYNVLLFYWHFFFSLHSNAHTTWNVNGFFWRYFTIEWSIWNFIYSTARFCYTVNVFPVHWFHTKRTSLLLDVWESGEFLKNWDIFAQFSCKVIHKTK